VGINPSGVQVIYMLLVTSFCAKAKRSPKSISHPTAVTTVSCTLWSRFVSGIPICRSDGLLHNLLTDPLTVTVFIGISRHECKEIPQGANW
jgi:hypothetical protein